MSNKDQKHPVDWDAMDDDDSDDSDESDSDKNSTGSHEEHKYARKPQEGYEEEEHHEHHGHHGHHGHHHKREYRDNYGGKKEYKQFKQPDPNGNYALYYRNDPDFVVKVIKNEPVPHEIVIKSTPLDHAQALSILDIKKTLAKWGVDECDVFITNSGYKITIVIATSSEDAVKIYSDLYDNAFNLFFKHKSRV